MEETKPTQRLSGAALSATLWHPYLALALHNLSAYALPAYRGSLVLICGAIAAAWLISFLAEYLLVPRNTPRWTHVDDVMQDERLGFAEKLAGIASSWLGRALLVGFAGYLGVLALLAKRGLGL